MNASSTNPSSQAQNLPKCIQQFMAYFKEMNLESVAELADFYAPEISFADPIHQIQGLASLQAYFTKLNKNATAVSFDFQQTDLTGHQASLQWVMTLKLKRPRKTIIVKGISVLSFDQQITAQRDYFDLGEMIYEHIPLLGGLLRRIKRKMAAPA